MKNLLPILSAHNISMAFGPIRALDGVSFNLYSGEIIAVVGESGSGKTTLLKVLSGFLHPDSGQVSYRNQEGDFKPLKSFSPRQLRHLHLSDWGYVHQNPRDGIRLGITAGANIVERLLAAGENRYMDLRRNALEWMRKVEIDPERIDNLPETFSGGMQQRLQIARTLISRPSLLFLDEPTGGLDVSVQASILDLLRSLAQEFRMAAIVVTHDLAVARLLADRIAVIQGGRIVETGITDQVLDDPQHPYTQLLVSSVLSI